MNFSSFYHREDPGHVRFNIVSNGIRRSDAVGEPHHGEARPISRLLPNNHNMYYSEQDASRQQIFRRAIRDAGSHDVRNIQTLVPPLPVLELSNRNNGHLFDPRSGYITPRGTNYHADGGFRQQAMMARGYNTVLPEAIPRREQLPEVVAATSLKRRISDGDGGSSNYPCKFFAAGFCRNGKYCRFSHRGEQPQDNNFNDNNNRRKWNGIEKSDSGKIGEVVSKGNSDPRKIGSSNWIDGIAMSPDWNYGVKSGVGVIGRSSQSGVLKDTLVTNYDSSLLPYGDKSVVVDKAIPAQNTATKEHIDEVASISALVAQVLESFMALNPKKTEEENVEDEKNKRRIRAFKFALVEMVKEILRPVWKEGKMDKDGYKNIVKKVVEKVIGTIRSGNIPQTQEKIDIYLAASKAKLAKLVQEYISRVENN